MKFQKVLLLLALAACSKQVTTSTGVATDTLLHVQASDEGVFLDANGLGIIAGAETITFADRPLRDAVRLDSQQVALALQASGASISGTVIALLEDGNRIPIRVNLTSPEYDAFSQSVFYNVTPLANDIVQFNHFTQGQVAQRMVEGSLYFQTTDPNLNQQLLSFPAEPPPFAPNLALTIAGEASVLSDERECYRVVRGEIAQNLAAQFKASPSLLSTIASYKSNPASTSGVQSALDTLGANISASLGISVDPNLTASMFMALKHVHLPPEHAIPYLVSRGICKALPYGEELGKNALLSLTAAQDLSSGCLSDIQRNTHHMLGTSERAALCASARTAISLSVASGNCEANDPTQPLTEPAYNMLLTTIGCQVAP